MLRLLIVLILQLLVNANAIASESAYVQSRRFMPLPPPKNNLNTQRTVSQAPAKFFPITQTRYPMAIRSEKNSVAAAIVKNAGKNTLMDNIPIPTEELGWVCENRDRKSDFPPRSRRTHFKNSQFLKCKRYNIRELPSDYAMKSGSGKKINMSQDDAKQIISIFTATK